jgi:hypothetical protein
LFIRFFLEQLGYGVVGRAANGSQIETLKRALDAPDAPESSGPAFFISSCSQNEAIVASGEQMKAIVFSQRFDRLGECA